MSMKKKAMETVRKTRLRIKKILINNPVDQA
jgi:hypothetical protein